MFKLTTKLKLSSHALKQFKKRPLVATLSVVALVVLLGAGSYQLYSVKASQNINVDRKNETTKSVKDDSVKKSDQEIAPVAAPAPSEAKPDSKPVPQKTTPSPQAAPKKTTPVAQKPTVLYALTYANFSCIEHLGRHIIATHSVTISIPSDGTPIMWQTEIEAGGQSVAGSAGTVIIPSGERNAQLQTAPIYVGNQEAKIRLRITSPNEISSKWFTVPFKGYADTCG